MPKRVTLNEYWTVNDELFDSLSENRFDTAHEAQLYATSRGLQVIRRGAQKDFVENGERYSAYIGGVGSGKTFALIARGLKFSQQPVLAEQYSGPRGLIGAISYPVLRDVVLPQFFELVHGSGLWKHRTQEKSYIKSEKKALLKANCPCADRSTCDHVAEILFRSLDDPNMIRGVELSWFGVDEGRHLTRETWDILLGRLRQKGFLHAGWVCSTPNGYDWMWQLFHPDSPNQLKGAVWFGAPTYENRKHLPDEYIKDLDANYEGKWHEQEVKGRFVGIMAGAVFPHWNPQLYLVDLEYDPSLPLYSFWDFGVGDLGVIEFAQLAHTEKELKGGAKEWVPELRFIGYIEAAEWGAKEWADAWRVWLDTNCGGRRPTKNIGDPAGRQRQTAAGMSMFDALAAHGVPVGPAPKKEPYYGALILDNLMAGGRVLVDKNSCPRVGAAFASHRWNVDEQGNRIGTRPVHDWTSHYGDAARYGATVVIPGFSPRRSPAPDDEPPGPGTMGHLIEQLLAPKGQWLGEEPRRVELQLGVKSPVGS